MSFTKKTINNSFMTLLFLLIFLHFSVTGVCDFNNVSSELVENNRFRVIFYNVENLFDIYNEPGKEDSDFTPEGLRRWNKYRLDRKIENVYKALVAAGGVHIPAVIGLCEVENRTVLKQLVAETGFKTIGYEIVHQNSADRRGIDVAALYDPQQFSLLDKAFYQIDFKFDKSATTRDILYLKGLTIESDTLHLFINHWPSRWGGQYNTEPYRLFAAKVLKRVTDSLLQLNSAANILIMGDFNDEPHDKSISQVLGAKYYGDQDSNTVLFNLSQVSGNRNKGTLKYQGEWFQFDQFIASGALINGQTGINIDYENEVIFTAPFLLITDQAWFGLKPFRTYEGFRYAGGYSDHLPIVVDLFW